jgi:gluconolactonase
MKFLALIAVLAPPLLAQAPQGIPGVVAPGVQPELIHEGYTWTEGPVGTADGGIFFTDIPGNTIYRVDPSGKITAVRENSSGANGLAVDKAGRLYVAEGDGKRISIVNQKGDAVTVLDKVGGQPLDKPNDLILDAKGGIYFTDPRGTPMYPISPDHYGTLYYSPPGGKPALALDEKLRRPNGLTLTLDGKTLLVADTQGDSLWAYDVQADGSVKNKHAFLKVPGPTDLGESMVDGMAIDSEGRIYLARGVGIQVFDKSAILLGTIAVPRHPANIAFSGPDKHTLYITARQGLYKLQMLSQGPPRPGK